MISGRQASDVLRQTSFVSSICSALLDGLLVSCADRLQYLSIWAMDQALLSYFFTLLSLVCLLPTQIVPLNPNEKKVANEKNYVVKNCT